MFPLFKTKIDNITKKFDLTDFNQRQEYFELKAGEEIKKLREYLKENTFIAYLLGKKSSGKGTYSKMFKEVVDKDRIEHFSIGDMIRDLDNVIADEEKKNDLANFLEKNYRGFLSVDEIMDLLENRSTETLLPSELILTLAKREIAQKNKKALFIDGFPRKLDQVSYSLFFRDLIDYREDPDVFVLIDVPEKVIDERIKYRVVCPICQTSRNLKLLPTKNVGYDRETGEFYLICDNPDCPSVKSGHGARMVRKEGDELGIDPIRNRLKTDSELIERAFSLKGVPKITLRNSVPVEKAEDLVDDYELTPEYEYRLNKDSGKIDVIEKPWKLLDEKGSSYYSLMPPPVVVSLIKQMVKSLNL